MELTEFKLICESTFRKLFSEAKEKNEQQFLASFFAIYENYNIDVLSYVMDYEFQEVLDFVETFHPIRLSDDVDDKIKVRTRLLLYCHIMEVDLIYMILFNMIRTIKNDDYSTIVNYKSNNGEICEAIYTYKKIELLKKESENLGIPLEPIYDELYINQLRNAIVHSQYFFTDPLKELNISKHLSPSSSSVYQKSNKKSIFKFDEINDIFEKSVVYLQTFIKIYRDFNEPYMDGNPHQTLFGKIRFDSRFAWGFFSEKM